MRQDRFRMGSVFVMTIVAFLAAPAMIWAQTQIESAVANLQWRELGPAVTGGRIADIAAVESKPATFYVGTASGGVWKTTSHGAEWEPIFDNETTASIGDVTIAQSNPNTVWVGTGEPQNRQSSPWGDGVYKSTDGGRTWNHMGLRETRHISRIVIHPTNPDIVYVAAVGHLWGPNAERGVYKTTDGGATWDLVLFVDENTGAIDLTMDPGDPATLLTAMYQRRRTGMGFNGGGPGSGIYRTTDGGSTWSELTDGLPQGDMGRIGIDTYRRDGNLVYAVIEAERRGGFGGGGGGQQPRGPLRGGVYRSTDRGDTWEQMSTTSPRPMYYSQIRIDPNDPDRIYLGGTQLMVSEDAGRTFRSDGAPGIHVDHHALWIDPSDSDHLLLGSDGGVSTSFNRGRNWRMYDNLPIGQFYQIGVDMRDPYYVCGGLQDNSSWCAPNNTLTTSGVRNRDWYDVWGGDGFYNVVDPNDHTIVFTSSQGGNMGRYNVTTGERQRLRPINRPDDDDDDDDERTFRWNWNAPLAISSHNSATIYLGANVLFRSTNRGVTWEEASPDLTKQIDRDEVEIMGVLPTDQMLSRHDGTSSYGNITAIAESPLNESVLYVGTDDGNVQVTQDGGANWSDITSRVPNLPERTYVSRLTASGHVEGRIYATFDGHRNDDYVAHVYVSEDFGNRWRSIEEGLPDGWSVNVIAEHPRTPNLLFVGNEIGVYVSTDRGDQWTRLKNNLPTVPVDDIVIHPRENDLILGTHGRSIWILPDVTPLEQLTDDVLASETHVFPTKTATMWSLSGGWPFLGAQYVADNPPVQATIRYYLREELEHDEAIADAENGGSQAEHGPDGVQIVIQTADGDTVRVLDGPTEPGINEVGWDFRLTPPEAPQGGAGQGGGGGGFGGARRSPKVIPGTYTLSLNAAGRSVATELTVRGDPRITISRSDLMARQEALLSLQRLTESIGQTQSASRRITSQLSSIKSLIEGADQVPEELVTRIDSLQSEVSELTQEISTASREARGGGGIEGSTTRPTTDQLWQIEQLWEKVPSMIERVNEIITTRLPAINRELNQHGVRPDPGDPVSVPRRSAR